MTDQCSTCRFWDATNPRNPDDGRCRRNAPPACHQWAAFTGEAIMALAHVLSEHFVVALPDGIDPEPTESTNAAGWPRTYGDDWCGEWMAP